jgi:MFS family permease
MKYTYKHTLYASYLGYITQAIINNLSPLLFVTFQREFQISLEQIGLLISLNFGVQIIVDLAAVRYVDMIGYRISAVMAHIVSTAGLFCLGVLPGVMHNPYMGLIIAVVLNSIGGGIIEVLISPIVESLPGDEKASAMSLLHSFYCWGHVAVVILSTLYFRIGGLNRWYYLPLLWALIPFFNALLFMRVPLRTLVEKHEQIPLRKLFTSKVFFVLFALMLCAGASEQAMSQWSSLFAEIGLGVSKTMGDLLGPCAFALLMGISRGLYGWKGSRLDLRKTLIISSICCAISYLLAVFSPFVLLSLIGCALVGLFVGIMWPGILSLSSETYPQGGTAMFAILAVAGDLGCSSGPGIVGLVSNGVQNANVMFLSDWFPANSMTEVGLKAGLLLAVVFPVIMAIGVTMLRKRGKAGDVLAKKD